MGNIFPKIESIKTVKFTKIEHYSTAQKKNETSFLEKRYFSVKMGEKLCWPSKMFKYILCRTNIKSLIPGRVIVYDKDSKHEKYFEIPVSGVGKFIVICCI